MDIFSLIYRYGTTNTKLVNIFQKYLMSAKMEPKILGIFFMTNPYGLKKFKIPHIDADSNAFTSMNIRKVAR